MSKAAELAALIGSQTALSNRNLIINGAMQVWQRGTSQTTSGDYGADRFWMANATSATRDTDAPSGFVYSTKLTYNSSDMSIGQPVELPATGEQGQLISGQTVTLSYYAKVDAGTEAISIAIKFRDAKFSATNEVAFTPTITNGQNATWTTTWTRFTHSFTIPTVASTNVLAGLEIGGISKTAYITGVQLELGEQATPFEHRSYGDELRRCQRYYEKSYQDACYFLSNSSAAQVQRQTNSFQVQKRTTPTRTQTRNAGSSNGGTSVTNVDANIDGILHAFGGSDNQVIFFSWTADAEL